MNLPVTVVGGYLGAGKTTLVNRLLRNAQGLRLAILVNDFGEVSIDADLIVGAEGGVLELAGGCVCCTVGNDLLGALLAMRERVPAPDHVVVETSGVALPRSVAGVVGLATGMRLSGVLVVADAETVQVRARDPYVGDTVERQLRDADLIVLNKTDLVAPERARQLLAWLAEQLPATPVVEAVRGDAPLEVLLAPVPAAWSAGSLRLERAGALSGALGPARHDALASFESRCLVRDVDDEPGPVVDALCAALRECANGLLRAKAIVAASDGRALAVHLVGTRIEVEPHATGSPAAGERDRAARAPGARLVLIGDRRTWQAQPLLERLIALGWRGADRSS